MFQQAWGLRTSRISEHAVRAGKPPARFVACTGFGLTRPPGGGILVAVRDRVFPRQRGVKAPWHFISVSR